MKLCFPQFYESKSRFLSYTVVAKALMRAGHEVVGSVEKVGVTAHSPGA